MKDRKYNGMFSICKEKMIFYNPVTGETTNHINLNISEYDLNNENVYNMTGELISEGEQVKYNSHFLIFFFRAHVLKVREFLNHHYKDTPDKDKFLDYLEYGILPNDKIKDGVKGLMSKWIQEQRKVLSDYPGTIKEFVNLVQEIVEHHLSTVNGFLDYRYGLVPEGIGSQGYWLLELHKHLFWAEQNEHPPEITDKLRWAHSWQEKKHKKLIIDFNRRVNGLDEETKGIKEPSNLNPEIFKNGFAYQMFLELKQLTVKERTRVADYSFIFHKMKDKNLKAINKVVTEPAFIEFLNEGFNADIGTNKLPFKNPDYKQAVFRTVLKKYKADILK